MKKIKLKIRTGLKAGPRRPMPKPLYGVIALYGIYPLYGIEPAPKTETSE